MNTKMVKIGLRHKIIFVLLPIIVICNILTFIVISSISSRVMRESAESNMRELADSTSFEIKSELTHTLGIMENVKNSIEGSCETSDDIKKYLYGVADAYPDIQDCPMNPFFRCDGIQIKKHWGILMKHLRRRYVFR